MKNIEKIAVTALIIIFIILVSVKLSMDNLKKETENGFKEIAQLHVNTYTEQINQILDNINITIDSISNQIKNELYIDTIVKSILSKNTYIRSINIINDENTIVFSSNKKNINQKVNISKYYPKPMFNSSILRFGNVKKGRDLFDHSSELSYVPVVKKIFSGSGDYSVLLILNNEYITNMYQNSFKSYNEKLEIIRFDDIILYSSVNNNSLGIKINSSKLYTESKNTGLSSGIESINSRKFITAYRSTDMYPLVISVKFDYEKNLEEWENKTFFTLLFIGSITLLIAIIVSKLILKYQNTKNKEIEYQKTLLENQEKIQNAYIVFDNTNDGILITDFEKNIIDINKAFTLNSGFTFDEVYEKNPKILKSNIHDENFYQNMWSEINTNGFWRGEIINRAKNGELYTELLTVNTVLNEHGEIKNYVGVFTNITKQKEQEIILKEQEIFIHQQSKMASLGEMLENIAHQWRQPLSVISTAATGMQMEKEFGVSTEEEEMHKLKVINDTAQHLSNTIDDFRDFFKPDKSKESFYIQDVVIQSLNILESKFMNRNIIVEENVSNIKIKGYKSELVQVFMNILNNARDAFESKDLKERFILIDIYKEEENVIIKIKDSAGGVDENNLEKIFEPYFTTKHKAQGTGIGLYMSEEIITKHMNGTIRVDNVIFVKNNQTLTGACFTISVPYI